MVDADSLQTKIVHSNFSGILLRPPHLIADIATEKKMTMTVCRRQDQITVTRLDAYPSCDFEIWWKNHLLVRISCRQSGNAVTWAAWNRGESRPRGWWLKVRMRIPRYCRNRRLSRPTVVWHGVNSYSATVPRLVAGIVCRRLPFSRGAAWNTVPCRRRYFPNLGRSDSCIIHEQSRAAQMDSLRFDSAAKSWFCANERLEP